MWRQGDIFIRPINKIPRGAARRANLVLAEGEVTGHAHRITDRDSAELFAQDGNLFLSVTADTAVITHEEHAPIELPQGNYSVWRQREYTPEAIVTVRD